MVCRPATFRCFMLNQNILKVNWKDFKSVLPFMKSRMMKTILLNDEEFSWHQSFGSNIPFKYTEDFAFPDTPNTETFAQLATLLREHFRPTQERHYFHSSVEQQGESIADFVHELKKLPGTCEFTNEQLNDDICDHFILWIAFTTCRAEALVKKLYVPRNSEWSKKKKNLHTEMSGYWRFPHGRDQCQWWQWWREEDKKRCHCFGLPYHT